MYGVLFCHAGHPLHLLRVSEWGALGEKHQGDQALRPCFEKPEENRLTEYLGKLSKIKSGCKALKDGGFQNLTLRNKQWIFARQCPEETVIVAVNAEGGPLPDGSAPTTAPPPSCSPGRKPASTVRVGAARL